MIAANESGKKRPNKRKILIGAGTVILACLIILTGFYIYPTIARLIDKTTEPSVTPIPTVDPTQQAMEARELQEKIDNINNMQPTDSGKFRIHYSTIGYDTRSTKRALIRLAVSADDSNTIIPGTWILKNLDNESVLTGTIAVAPKTYGMDFWEVNFSDFDIEGHYYLYVHMDFDGKEEQFRTMVFSIKQDLLSSDILKGISLYNAEARVAPQSAGGGFYDCNWSTMGEGYSHGVFLNGLVQTYKYKKDELTEDEQSRFINVSNIGFDYLLSLVLPTGEIDHQNPARPYYQGTNFGIMNSQEGLYGMAAYIDIMKGLDDRANDENYDTVVRALEFVEIAKPYGYRAGYDAFDENLIPVYLHLYNYSGDEYMKDEAIRLLNTQLEAFDLRGMWRASWRAIPMFEGLKMCVDMFPEHPDYDYWVTRATEIKDEYFYDIIERNAYMLITTSPAMYARAEWDDMSITPKGDPLYGGINLQAASAYSIDASILGEITGDFNMEKVAFGELAWILGINPGLPQWAVVNPTASREREAAAFITGLKTRSVDVEYNAWTPANDGILSIVNGFSMYGMPFRYDHIWQNSENFIKWDGTFAYAICVYENLLDNRSE